MRGAARDAESDDGLGTHKGRHIVRTTLRRSLAATAAGAVVAAAALATTGPAAVAAEAPRPVLTTFGFGGYAFGTQLATDGVVARGATLGFSELKCTQAAGRAPATGSVTGDAFEAAVPARLRSLVDAVGVLRTSNRSYRADGGAVNASESRTSLDGLAIGGATLGDIPVPRLVVTGLTSTAVARHVAGKGYQSIRGFGFADLDLEVPEDSVVAGTPLAELLEAVAKVDDGGPVRELVDTLTALTAGDGLIAIPNFGSIDMRAERGSRYPTGATAEASTLIVTVDPDGASGREHSPTRLTLGRAFARIGGPAHDGVFRSHSVPLELNVLGTDALSFRSDGVKSIGCEGSAGRTVRRGFPDVTLGEATTGLGALVVEGARSEFSGSQFRRGRIVDGRRTRRPWARGTMRTTISRLAVPQAGVELTDLVTAVRVNTQRLVRRNGVATYTRSVTRTVGSVRLGNRPHALPAVGEEVTFDFDGGRGVLEVLPTGSGRMGRTVVPLRLTLFPGDGGDVLRMVIGEASMHVARRN